MFSKLSMDPVGVLSIGSQPERSKKMNVKMSWEGYF